MTAAPGPSRAEEIARETLRRSCPLDSPTTLCAGCEGDVRKIAAALEAFGRDAIEACIAATHEPLGAIVPTDAAILWLCTACGREFQAAQFSDPCIEKLRALAQGETR